MISWKRMQHAVFPDLARQRWLSPASVQGYKYSDRLNAYCGYSQLLWLPRDNGHVRNQHQDTRKGPWLLKD